MKVDARAGSPRDIAIVMLSALGDAVHVLPVLNALKRAWASRITWIVQPAARAFAGNHPAVDEFVLFKRRKGLNAVASYTELRRSLARRHFDLAMALQVYFKAGLITGLLDADVKLGFDRSRARDLNWIFTNERIPPHPTQHVQDQYFEFLRYLGIDPEPVEWRITLSDQEKEQQATFFSTIDAPVCSIVIGTSRPEKNWPAEKYAGLIDHMAEVHGIRSVLVGGISQLERDSADRILALARHRPVDALANDIRRLVWLLAGSALAVSPDTGPLHMARALDVPVVGLYGYSNPKRYGPYRKYTDLVVDGYARFAGEDYPASMEWRPEGMGRVTVEATAEKVDLAVRRYLRR